MRLEGSCHCGRVRFAVETDWFYPFMWCHCVICRKTCGSAFACNLKAPRGSLEVQGSEHVRIYTAVHCRRHFCGTCGSPLYILDDRWPEGCWPFASAIDTPLPRPPRVVHIFTSGRAPWFELCYPGEEHAEWPPLSIEEYHERFVTE